MFGIAALEVWGVVVVTDVTVHAFEGLQFIDVLWHRVEPTFANTV